MNLLAEIRKSVTPELVEVVSNQINEDKQKTKFALESYMSILLGSFMKRASTEMGARSILNHIEKESFDGSLSASMNGKLQAETVKKIGEKGSSLFSLLTPDKKSIIISTISSHAKIRNSSSVTLLGISTPLVLDAIGKFGKSKGADPIELMTFLADQKEAYGIETGEVLLEKSIEVLGLKEYLNSGNTIVVQSSKNQALNYEEDSSKGSEIGAANLKNIIIGLIALMVLGGGIYWFLNRSAEDTATNEQENVVINSTDSLANVIDTSSVKLAPAVSDTTSGTEIAPKTVEPQVVAPKVPVLAIAGLTKGGVAEQLATYLSDSASVKGKTFSYGNLEFDPASTNLSPASGNKIDELIKVLNKYPNAQLKIVGYVGKTADSLKARGLSFKRANSVKSLIASKGINTIRLDVEGKGRSTSVPRIDFKIVKK